MTRFLRTLFLCSALLGPASAWAADAVVMLPVQPTIDSPRAQQHLDGSVRFYFGEQPAPRVVQDLGEYVTNKKTNGFLKGEENSCEWALIDALRTLQKRAHALGGNAVIHIHSYYRRHDVSNNTMFECHKGMLIAGVALRGEVVKLAPR